MLNKLDILSGIETIRLCVAYEIDGRRVEVWPSSGAALSRATPIYETFPGWERADPRHPLAGRPARERPALRVRHRGARRACRSCSCRSGRSGPRPSSAPGGRCATGRGCRREPRDADPDPGRRRRRPRARAGLEAGRPSRASTRSSSRRAVPRIAAEPRVRVRARRGSARPGRGRRGRPARGGRAGRDRAGGAAGGRRRRCARATPGSRSSAPSRGGRADRVEQGVLPRGRRARPASRMARAAAFADAAAAIAFAAELAGDGRGVVVKADGLAAGKGVTVCDTAPRRSGPSTRLRRRPCRRPAPRRSRGSSSRSASRGPEASLIAVCDGRDAVALPLARDHKRLLDGDRGPNTGGMGAYSPLPDLADAAADGPPGRVPPADPGRAGPARHPVPWRPVRRPDADRRRPGPARVQRPLRRPGDAGHPAAARPSRSGRSCWRAPAATSGRSCAAPRAAATAGCRRSRAQPSAIVLAAAGYPDAPRGGDPIDGPARRRGHGRARLPCGHDPRPGRHGPDGRRAGPDRRRARRGSARPRGAAPAAADLIHAAGLQHRTRHRGVARPIERRAGQRRGGDPMIPRYTLPEMGAIWSDVGPLRGDAPGRAGGRPRPGRPRARSRPRRWPPSRRSRASTSSGSPRSSGRPTTTSSPSSARSPRRSGRRAATSISG